MDEVVNLDTVFGSLTDATRRDILRRVTNYHLSVGQIAEAYNLSFAAVSKHLKVLEKAGLIIKRRIGRKHYIHLAPGAFTDASEYLDWYKGFMSERYESLDIYLRKEQ
jgi:DNA-binding transcriptional ArsR family regulator